MSEYQYYEFQAVDRPLTEAEMRHLRAISTRASITPTRFVNEYHFGDLKGDPAAWMEKFFDAHLYLANWGTRALMLRLPSRLLDPSDAERYCPGEFATSEFRGDFVILSFHSEDESGNSWDHDGDGWLASILPVRAELASGDHRALYLAWLLCAQDLELDEDEPEPPVPPGLGKLTAAQGAFADFLRIDPDLIAAAAERSAAMEDGPGRAELAAWIAALPEAEKTALLVRAAADGDVHVRTELLRRLRAERTEPGESAEPRTVGELLAAAERHAEARQRAEAERAAREKARREREAAEQRRRFLDELSSREGEAWRQAAALIATKRPTEYDKAVQLLRDLHDLATREGRGAEAEARIQALAEEHAKKPAFLDRLRKALAKRA